MSVPGNPTQPSLIFEGKARNVLLRVGHTFIASTPGIRTFTNEFSFNKLLCQSPDNPIKPNLIFITKARNVLLRVGQSFITSTTGIRTFTNELSFNKLMHQSPVTLPSLA